MVQDGSVHMTFLKSVCEPIQQTGKAGKLVAEVLHDAAHRLVCISLFVRGLGKIVIRGFLVTF